MVPTGIEDSSTTHLNCCLKPHCNCIASTTSTSAYCAAVHVMIHIASNLCLACATHDSDESAHRGESVCKQDANWCSLALQVCCSQWTSAAPSVVQQNGMKQPTSSCLRQGCKCHHVHCILYIDPVAEHVSLAGLGQVSFNFQAMIL